MKGSCGTAENVQFSFAHEICKKIKKCNFIFCFVYVHSKTSHLDAISKLNETELRVRG